MITATAPASSAQYKRHLMHEVRHVFGATCESYCGLSFIYEQMKVNSTYCFVTCLWCIAKYKAWHH